MSKFKVGDIVVGNSGCDDVYWITKEGVKCRVVNLYQNGNLELVLLDGDSRLTYQVVPDCFDLYKPIEKFKRGDVVLSGGAKTPMVVYECKDNQVRFYISYGGVSGWNFVYNYELLFRDGVKVEPDLSKFEIPIGGI